MYFFFNNKIWGFINVHLRLQMFNTNDFSFNGLKVVSEYIKLE